MRFPAGTRYVSTRRPRISVPILSARIPIFRIPRWDYSVLPFPRAERGAEWKGKKIYKLGKLSRQSRWGPFQREVFSRWRARMLEIDARSLTLQPEIFRAERDVVDWPLFDCCLLRLLHFCDFINFTCSIFYPLICQRGNFGFYN